MTSVEPIGAMNDLAPLAVVKDYGELHLAMRARKESLQISNETLADLSGMHGGHVNKMMAVPPSKKMGIVAFGNILQALALKLLVVEDPEMMCRMAGRMTRRAEKQVRKASLDPAQAVANYKRRFALKGVRSRLKATTAEQRSAIAQTAARVRWHKKGNGKSNDHSAR
jgi:hypothetical protein